MRVANPVTPMHTRVPRYVRNHVGTVVQALVRVVPPDGLGGHGSPRADGARLRGGVPGRELFGDDADHTLVVDVWERDLEEAT